MTLYIFISIDMNHAFCHFYDKDTKHSPPSLKILYTTQHAFTSSTFKIISL